MPSFDKVRISETIKRTPVGIKGLKVGDMVDLVGGQLRTAAGAIATFVTRNDCALMVTPVQRATGIAAWSTCAPTFSAFSRALSATLT